MPLPNNSAVTVPGLRVATQIEARGTHQNAVSGISITPSQAWLSDVGCAAAGLPRCGELNNVGRWRFRAHNLQHMRAPGHDGAAALLTVLMTLINSYEPTLGP